MKHGLECCGGDFCGDRICLSAGFGEPKQIFSSLQVSPLKFGMHRDFQHAGRPVST